MTNTIKQAIAYAKAHKTRDGKTWDQWCLSFVYRCLFNGTSGPASYPTAYQAYKDANANGHIYGRNWATAPACAIHYFGFSASNPGAGHIGFTAKAGGKEFWNASKNASHQVGTAMGYNSSVGEYLARTGLDYLGWGELRGYHFAGAPLDPAEIKAAKAKEAKAAAAAKAKAAAAAKKAAELKAKAEAAEAAAKAAAAKKAKADAEKKLVAAANAVRNLQFPAIAVPPTFYFKGVDKPEIYEFQHGEARHVEANEWGMLKQFFGVQAVEVPQSVSSQLIAKR